MGIISRYIGGLYLRALFLILLLLLSAVYTLDTLELLRRFASRDLPVTEIMVLGLLKLPQIGRTLIPFGVLFAALFIFWRLTRTQELIVVRSVGVSAWRYLTPVVVLTFLFGVLQVTAINPVSSAALARYLELESQALSGRAVTTRTEQGVFMREQTKAGFAILAINEYDPQVGTMEGVTISLFGEQGRPGAERIRAAAGALDRIRAADGALDQEAEDGRVWAFRDAWYASGEGPAQPLSGFQVPTETTLEEVRTQLSAPPTGTISLWELMDRLADRTEEDFATQRLRLELHTLLSKPLLYVATVLIAAAFTVRNPRQAKPLRLIALGLITCFSLYFLDDLATTLGLAGQVPVFLAAWTPALIASGLGITLLLFLEDG